MTEKDKAAGAHGLYFDTISSPSTAALKYSYSNTQPPSCPTCLHYTANMPNETFDYGDLRITLTSEWDWKYNDKGTRARRYVEVHHAKSQGDMRPLGSFAYEHYQNQNGIRATVLVGNSPNNEGKSAVASPVKWEWRWDDGGSGGDHDGTFWRPIPPAGYVSLGDVCRFGYEPPALSAVWCVRSDLVMQSDFYEQSIWDDGGSGAKKDGSLWGIAPPSISASGSDKLPVLCDLFRCNYGYGRPPTNEAHVLVIPCPKDFKRFQAPLPTFTQDTLPQIGDVFDEMQQCEYKLPFTIFFPSTDRASLAQIAHPFCRLARRTAWIVRYPKLNGGPGTATDKFTVTKGVSKTESDEMTHSAGVNVSAGFGIKGVGVDISLNYQFTSTHSTSYNEYVESSHEQSYTVPPHSATVFLNQHVWLRATRSDGSSVLRETGFNANELCQFSGCEYIQK